MIKFFISLRETGSEKKLNRNHREILSCSYQQSKRLCHHHRLCDLYETLISRQQSLISLEREKISTDYLSLYSERNELIR